jgi:hypothetical protein
MLQRGRWRALGVSMAAGGLYDLAFAVAILGFLRPAASLLGLAVPAEPVYLRLVGILLAMLGTVYLHAAVDPRRRVPIVLVAAVGRVGGAVLFVAEYLSGAAPVFVLLGLSDLGFAVWHGVALGFARRGERAEPSSRTRA